MTLFKNAFIDNFFVDKNFYSFPVFLVSQKLAIIDFTLIKIEKPLISFVLGEWVAKIDAILEFFNERGNDSDVAFCH